MAEYYQQESFQKFYLEELGASVLRIDLWQTPAYGAPLVVLGAPLTIDAEAFRTADGDIEGSLRLICERVHAHGDVPVGRK